MKAVNREFGPPGQIEGRSTRRWTGSLAALQRRKLPHVPGMRCPNPPGVCCVCVYIRALAEPRQCNTSILNVIHSHTHFSAYTRTYIYRHTHTRPHTLSPGEAEAWLLIHNTRPEREQRQRSVFPKSSAEVTVVERY